MMNRALACLLGAVGLLLCAGVARAQLEPVPALGLGLLLKEIVETVNEAESANDDDNEPEEEKPEPELEPEPELDPEVEPIDPVVAAFIAAVASGEKPAVPSARPTPDKTYESLQQVVREQDALIALGIRPRPSAPAREDAPRPAPDAEVPPPPQQLAAENTRRPDPIFGPEGEPFPFPDYRPSQAPVHVILPDSDHELGHITVNSDGTRSVVAANTSKPKSQPTPNPDASCPSRLRALGVSFSKLPDFRKESGCQNIGVLEVTNFGNGVSANPNVHVTCEIAEGMALWIRNSVQNETARYFGSRVVKLSNTHGYSCRFRSGGRVSEHGFANAIDIGTFHLADGRRVSVLDNWHPDGTPFGANASRWFDRINESACDYFQLVLNPRSNKAHENHFHFDQGRWKSCD